MNPDHKIAHLWKKRMDRYVEEAYPIRKTMLATELAQQKENSKAKLPQPYITFRDVFEKKTIDELPPSRTFDHPIELNEGFSPKVAKVYPLNPKEQEACRAFVDEHLKFKKIIPSKSPQASPLLQFSSSILIYSLFLSFPIATIEEAISCLTIAFSFSLVIILSPYLIFSSLIYGLILSSTGSLTPVSISHFHNILLVSFCFLF